MLRGSRLCLLHPDSSSASEKLPRQEGCVQELLPSLFPGSAIITTPHWPCLTPLAHLADAESVVEHGVHSVWLPLRPL